MNPFAVVSLFSFVLLVAFSIAIFVRNPKSLNNKLCAALISSFAASTLFEFGYLQAQNAEQAHFWWKLDIVWPVALVLNLYFIIVFTERSHWLKSRIVNILLCLPGVTAIVLEVGFDAITGPPQQHYWGWWYTYQTDSIPGIVASLWIEAGYATCFGLAFSYFRRIGDERKRRQARLVALIEGVGMSNILIEAGISSLGFDIPKFHGVAFLIVSAILGYAIWKHDLLALTPITVAENIVTAMADSLLLVNTQHRIEACNAAAMKMLECSEIDLYQVPADIIFARNVEKPKWLLRNASENSGEKIEYLDTRFVSSTGKHIPVWLSTSVLYDTNGNNIGYLVIARDITERNRREQELKVFKNHLERLVAERTSELERSLADLKKESDERVKVERERENLEEDRDSLEQQLYHAQKLESIGRLAGGVAHDFNNLLFVINTYSEGFLYNLSTQDPLFHDFQEIHKAAKRATTLTQQLLAFSRKQIASPSIIDPNEAIKQLQRMLERLIGEHISINVVPGINVGNIRIDSGQLDQVMMNLAVNARDAMPGGGTITVEINQVRLGRADLKGRNSVCPGIYVLIRFTDNGVGMDEHTKSKMFDPFFSTKGPGKGTGLGLSTIYGIVKQNGGFIEVDSSLGVGTTFTVYFPQYEPDNISNMLLNQNNGELEGSETILLVEDEQQVRKLAAKLLRHLGYNVIEARGASEAATIFHECHQEIDLLFTDIVMPGMNGKQLSRLLGVTKPHLKVLFMSGYNDEISDNMGQLDPKTAFIAKPFSSSDLSMKLREVLDAKL